ncbi:MAG: SdrD B-like domain-containing protein [Hyphomicrobiaceae bacterium]
MPAGGELLLRLKLVVGAGLRPGTTNLAHVEDGTGAVISNTARAAVALVPDPTLECSELISKVFDDKNRNGYQDAGEGGLPGIRLATVSGFQITTDEHGRYHFPCAVVADLRRGSNFILKLDTRSLPAGYQLTTENPRVIRMRYGRMGKINFGAARPPLVEIHISDVGKLSGKSDLAQALAAAPRICTRATGAIQSR